MVEIDLQKEKCVRGGIADTALNKAIEAINQDGLVVFNNAVDPSHLDVLMEKMWQDSRTIMAQTAPPFQFVAGHIQQDPPPFLPYLFNDVLYNQAVIDLSQAILGQDVKNTFYSGNTNLPGSLPQPLHVDNGQLWPDLKTAHPPYELVINICPLDISPENGSTELWPGSHLDTTITRQSPTIRVPATSGEQRRQSTPPIQPSIKKGGMLIRDVRLWHRGMPNYSSTPRPMLAMIHAVSWMFSQPLVFRAQSKTFFKQEKLAMELDFSNEPISYLERHSTYDYHSVG